MSCQIDLKNWMSIADSRFMKIGMDVDLSTYCPESVNIMFSSIARVHPFIKDAGQGGPGEAVYCLDTADVNQSLTANTDYRLSFLYASGEKRPVKISLNGQILNNCSLAENTGGFTGQFCKRETICDVRLMNGKNTLKIHSDGPIPTIMDINFVTVGPILWNLNLPGTHDSAAINPSVHTPWACHHKNLTQQLESGVRLLDIRLKVNKNQDGSYTFGTCHGNIGCNEYQSFESAMTECANFLTAQSGECIAMSLKVDDWNGFGGDELAVTSTLTNYLHTKWGQVIYDFTGMNPWFRPDLSIVRGKIYLINRINNDGALGIPLSWSDNTTGQLINLPSGLQTNIYVQDKYSNYQGNPDDEKLQYFQAAIKTLTDSQNTAQPISLLLNYGTGIDSLLCGVSVILGYLIACSKVSASERPAVLGWSLLDYEDTHYPIADLNGRNGQSVSLVDYLVASNFGYIGFEKPFFVYT